MTGRGRNLKEQTAYVPRQQEHITPPSVARGLGRDECVWNDTMISCFKTFKKHQCTISELKYSHANFSTWSKWHVMFYLIERKLHDMLKWSHFITLNGEWDMWFALVIWYYLSHTGWHLLKFPFFPLMLSHFYLDILFFTSCGLWVGTWKWDIHSIKGLLA